MIVTMLVFDYQKSMVQVSQLRQIADELRKMQSNELAEAISSIGASWKGETAQKFLTKCNGFRIQIEKEALNVSNIADSLEATANMIAKEESQAATQLGAL